MLILRPWPLVPLPGATPTAPFTHGRGGPAGGGPGDREGSAPEWLTRSPIRFRLASPANRAPSASAYGELSALRRGGLHPGLEPADLDGPHISLLLMGFRPSSCSWRPTCPAHQGEGESPPHAGGGEDLGAGASSWRTTATSAPSSCPGSRPSSALGLCGRGAGSRRQRAAGPCRPRPLPRPGRRPSGGSAKGVRGAWRQTGTAIPRVVPSGSVA